MKKWLCFSEGLAATEKNGKYGYINKPGKTLVPLYTMMQRLLKTIRPSLQRMRNPV